ncbi:hypothetical protein SAMN05421749_11119 [Acinetobacter marinus]|uniref:Uncharacterized protein n=1 Tax=Acinetobacter marinus TaxID=281375 RepID=A0A1G6NXP8_9GAMM|nr:hypothetical protein [Acinetobacter marinus]SDC72007.1 hypothetical protein SAMN05421749_11119 [Acinetobacter marinus]
MPTGIPVYRVKSQPMLALLLLLASVMLVGCKDTLEQIVGMTQDQRPDAAYQSKLKTDLKAFDQIRSQQNGVFDELDQQLSFASKKSTSSAQIRQSLQDISGTLSSQNEQFKKLHIHTPEVARLRNAVMQLNYSTMQIVALVDNPNAVNSRLNRYKSMQKNYINRYKHLRTEIESKLL